MLVLFTHTVFLWSVRGFVCSCTKYVPSKQSPFPLLSSRSLVRTEVKKGSGREGKGKERYKKMDTQKCRRLCNRNYPAREANAHTSLGSKDRYVRTGSRPMARSRWQMVELRWVAVSSVSRAQGRWFVGPPEVHKTQNRRRSRAQHWKRGVVVVVVARSPRWVEQTGVESREGRVED